MCVCVCVCACIGKRLLASNNDCIVRNIDINSFKVVNEYHADWCINV